MNPQLVMTHTMEFMCKVVLPHEAGHAAVALTFQPKAEGPLSILEITINVLRMPEEYLFLDYVAVHAVIPDDSELPTLEEKHPEVHTIYCAYISGGMAGSKYFSGEIGSDYGLEPDRKRLAAVTSHPLEHYVPLATEAITVNRRAFRRLVSCCQSEFKKLIPTINREGRYTLMTGDKLRELWSRK